MVDSGPEGAAAALSRLKAGAPPRMATVRSVQWALPHVKHRFLVSEGPDALYVAFMGTKVARDLVTNANVWQEVGSDGVAWPAGSAVPAAAAVLRGC